MWEVYIVRTVDGKLYTGITKDIERRLQEHRDGKRGAKFFRISAFKELVFRETWPDRAAASRREQQIKQLNLKQKLELIAPPG